MVADIIFPNGQKLSELGSGGGFSNPAEEDLDMNGFKVKTTETGKDLVFEVPAGQKIVFSRSTA